MMALDSVDNVLTVVAGQTPNCSHYGWGHDPALKNDCQIPKQFEAHTKGALAISNEANKRTEVGYTTGS